MSKVIHISEKYEFCSGCALNTESSICDNCASGAEFVPALTYVDSDNDIIETICKDQIYIPGE